MVLGLQAMGGEGPLQPPPELLGDMAAAGVLDEDELAIADLEGDAGKHLIVLGQILVQRLPGPVDSGRRPQP